MSPQLIILHGALGSAAQFAVLKEELDVPSLAVDFIGHGNQPDIETAWSIELFASQLESILEGMPQPLPIFGYSMGGYVALWLSLRRPDLISRVLTLGTKVNWTVQGAQEEVTRVPHKKTAELMLALGAEPLLTVANVTNVTIPVRYMVGDRDKMVSVEETQAFYRATPGAEFAVLPNTRHSIEKVNVHRLTQEVSEFLFG